MRPHLVQDLRLLWHALRLRAGNGMDPPQEEAELLRGVFDCVTTLATDTLGALCAELQASAPASRGHGAVVAQTAGAAASSDVAAAPQLDIFSSPVAEPLATLGVRAKMRCTPGSLMCFYPGRIFLAGERDLPRSDMLFANEYEGVSMDGAGWLPVVFRESPVLAEAPKTTMWHGNRLAVGNLCNHPPAGTLPNLVPMAFRWPTWQELGQQTPAQWARLVPHVVLDNGQIVRSASGERAEPAGGAERVWFPPWPHMGMALIAIRTIELGDELFWNYRLHPRSDSQTTAQYPPWYTPVDDAALAAAVREAA
eukprot:CAMPEP_0170266382 /NCGR_PEP_ID=MMETSP0116_2-20130129/33104_1 /TAXON_ID=400756 /ORGANISM="Durinskia baltica, Strain CSIRO CS-38" /LENGTH=309 /DNA_ID=CAMNT_0010517511 /DNA_START=82 /DNA_END=1008 /DNA_ORIENTATION=-